MKVGIRRKLFLSILTIILIAIAVQAVVFYQFLENELSSLIRQELLHHAKAVRVILQKSELSFTIEAVDPILSELGDATGARITVILENGSVVGDSDVPIDTVASLENHKDREEFVSAVKTGEGTSRRYSRTLETDMLYVAVPFSRGDVRGVVRVSKPLSEISGFVDEFRSLLVIAGLVGLGIAALMSAMATYLFSRTLRVLVRFAKLMAEGKGKGRIELASPDELGGLAGSLNALSEQLERQVTSLAEERDRFEAVLEGMSEAVIALDEDQRVVLINRAGILLLGLSGRSTGQMLLETIRLPVIHELVKGLEPGENKTAEFELNDDSRRRILAMATRRRKGGVVVVLHDVSELRHLERVRRDFVSNVSHELRTPVSIIRANAETLKGGAMDDKEIAVRFLDSMLKNAERLSNLISDLLDISQIEEGKYRIINAPVSLQAALKRAEEAFKLRAAEKNFVIRVEPAGELGAMADARALDQVLFNLVDNAVKYAKEGGFVVLRAMEQADCVRIEVEDNGLGIEPVHRKRLFERFYRVDPGRSREMGGTGLGLAIVKHLVLAMGGSVGVEPAKRRGSIFWVHLPRATDKK